MNEEIKGHPHPMTLLIDKICRIFGEMGFDVVDGPELEREWYNFEALNVPKDHPARDLHDTFFLKLAEDKHEGKAILRSHTSNVQIRYLTETMNQIKSGQKLEAKVFPLAICVPGKVFRNEATDATHEAEFYQLEGLLLGENISLANLKGVIERFYSGLFGKEIKVRFRSSFFPFVEPGMEVDIQCFKCDGSGCNLCKKVGWIEVGGAGMIHPKVLKNCGLDSTKYAGFAFGFGLDRILLLKYGLNDIRSLYSGDLRVVNQF